MPYTDILIHAVWGTKSRYPFLQSRILPLLLHHIVPNTKSKGIKIIRVNGSVDHLHFLYRLDKEMTVSKTIQLIKGESSFWVNKEKLTQKKFEWADEYFAISVSPSGLENVIRYIDHQQKHHKQHTFEEEYEALLKSIGQG